MLVLVTRPRDQSGETARLLHAAGHDVLVDPVLEIRRLPVPSAPTGVHAIAVTSANAVHALAGLPGAPLFAVGDATARVLRAAGREPAATARPWRS